MPNLNTKPRTLELPLLPTPLFSSPHTILLPALNAALLRFFLFFVLFTENSNVCVCVWYCDSLLVRAITEITLHMRSTTTHAAAFCHACIACLFVLVRYWLCDVHVLYPLRD